jgi:hypothetical protein
VKGLDTMTRYYDPEYNREISSEQMHNQFLWFVNHGMTKTYEQFIADNFKVVKSKKELERWINA